MPGIVGVVSSDPRRDEAILDRMASAICHKPNYVVSRQRSRLGLFACVHLGLFDHAVSVTSPDSQVGLLLDGWIFEPLDGSGERTDSGLDIAAYCLQRYLSQGIDFVRQINGQFNLVIWDERQGSVWLCNDRYGLRPLQYSVDGDGLLFAPEGKAILAGTKKSPKLDRITFVNYLLMGRAVPGSRTFFEGIQSLPAASILRWKNGQVTHTRYWDYVYKPRDVIDDDFIDELVEAFRRGVRRYIKPKYRYAITLSGGLDSRVVASALAQETQRSALACTFGMSESQEVTLARATADRLGMLWKYIPLEPKDFIVHASEAARLNEGLDLCVQGYALLVHSQLREYADIGFSGLSLDVSLGGSFLDTRLLDPDMDSERAWGLLRKKLSNFDDNTLRSLVNCEHGLPAVDNVQDVWEPGLKHTNWADHTDRFVLQYRQRRIIFLRQIWQRLFLEDATPTFDYDFIDLILQIPTRERLEHRTYRRFMQRLCPELMEIPYQRTLLPPAVPVEFWGESTRLEERREALYFDIWRATQGQVHLPYKRHGTNYDEWLRADEGWKAWTDKLLMSDDCRLLAFGLNPSPVHQMVEEHRTGQREHRQCLLQLLTLESFLREYFA